MWSSGMEKRIPHSALKYRLLFISSKAPFCLFACCLCGLSAVIPGTGTGTVQCPMSYDLQSAVFIFI